MGFILPEERPLNSDLPTYRAAEKTVAFWACYLMPIVTLLLIPIWGRLMPYLINLGWPKSFWVWGDFSRPQRLLQWVFLALLPLLWLFALKTSARGLRLRHPALILAFLLVMGAGTLLQFDKVRWTFLEALKVRAEYEAYPRSMAYWQRERMDFQPSATKPTVLLVGSSQINLGTDIEQLRTTLPNLQIEKKALPGFGIMQYLASLPEIIRYKPQKVVCLISEFDTFREDRLPANRLRYFIQRPELGRLIRILGPQLAWANRAELGDLLLSTMTPLWRDRDLVRRLALDFWWNPNLGKIKEGLKTGEEKTHDLEVGRENLHRSIKRTGLLEANFKTFEEFTVALREKGISLVVLDGMIHPLASNAYPAEYRQETRFRLQEMSKRQGFVYLDQGHMPEFSAEDFMDAYHLGKEGKDRLTRFLSQVLAQGGLGSMTHVQMSD